MNFSNLKPGTLKLENRNSKLGTWNLGLGTLKD
jgi:hypothetical protein